MPCLRFQLATRALSRSAIVNSQSLLGKTEPLVSMLLPFSRACPPKKRLGGNCRTNDYLNSRVSLVFVLALSRQPCVNPVLLASGIVAYVRVTQHRQLTGGVLRSISSRTGAINHDVRFLVRQKCRRQLCHLVGRQVDRAGQMRVMISSRRQSLDQLKLVSAINL